MGRAIRTPTLSPHPITALTSVRALDDADQLHGEEVQTIEPFHPAFTYPIYGEKEAIFGYKDLEIKVRGTHLDQCSNRPAVIRLG